MATCSAPKCVALATNGTLCAPHAAGYGRHDNSRELRCENCRVVIKKDEWYRRVGQSVLHAKSCKTHPEVIAERAKVASA